MQSHYEILEVKSNATFAEIKKSANQKLLQAKNQLDNLIHDHDELVLLAINDMAKIFLSIYDKKDLVLAQIIFQYLALEDITSERYAECELHRKKVEIAASVLNDPKKRFSYDRFELGLAEPRGLRTSTPFFKDGVMDLSEYLLHKRQMNCYEESNEIIELKCKKHLKLIRSDGAVQGLSLKTVPIIVIGFKGYIEKDHARLIKPFSEHFYYPVSENELLPLFNQTFNDLYRCPAYVIKDPHAILMFIQQCKVEDEKLFEPGKSFGENLLQIERELYSNYHNLQFPMPYHIVSQEYSQELLTCAAMRAEQCRFTLSVQKESSYKLFSTKKSDCAALDKLEQGIRDYRLTKKYAVNKKPISSLIHSLKDQYKNLEKNMKIKSLFSELERLEKKISETIQEINTIRKYLENQFEHLGLSKIIISLICDYIQDTNPIHEVEPIVVPRPRC